MNARRLRLPLVLLTLALVPQARAQDPERLESLFPMDVGRGWTYTMAVTVDGARKAIQYDTEVVRIEHLDGVGPCAVFESRSDRRLLQTEWYSLEGGALTNPRRQDGERGPAASFPARVLLTAEALERLGSEGGRANAGGDADPEPSWSWESACGTARGTVTLVRREHFRLRDHGFLECVVLRDEGTFELGKAQRRQRRWIWLAPELGIVKETMAVEKMTGEVTIETESRLLRRF